MAAVSYWHPLAVGPAKVVQQHHSGSNGNPDAAEDEAVGCLASVTFNATWCLTILSALVALVFVAVAHVLSLALIDCDQYS